MRKDNSKCEKTDAIVDCAKADIMANTIADQGIAKGVEDNKQKNN